MRTHPDRKQRGSFPAVRFASAALLTAMVIALGACAAAPGRGTGSTAATTSDAPAIADAASGQTWTIPSNEDIRRLLAERMQHNGVGIVVGVIDAGGRRVVGHGRSGAADGRPLDGETVFQIGSVTKVFTSLLLADMVLRGEVALDDPASDYLPAGVGMPEQGRPITLRDLATHRSGLPSMPTNLSLYGEPDPYEAYSVGQLYQFLSGYTPDREPGAKAEYSNLAVSLLGRLLARRAGMDYEALLQQRVLQPLGMSSTSIALSSDQLRRLAHGHDRYLRPVRTWEMRNMPASGSLRSTANDLLKFLAACLGYEDTPLRQAIDLQLRERVPADSGWQALGWFVTSAGIAVHAGGKQGYRSAVAFDPATGRGVVVLANARTDDQPIGLAVHLLTGKALAAAPPAPRKDIIAVDRETLDGYAGHYRIAPDRIIEVARRDSHLLLHTPGQGVWEFFPTAAGHFFLNTGNDELSFETDADGRVTGLVWYGDGRDGGEGTPATRID